MTFLPTYRRRSGPSALRRLSAWLLVAALLFELPSATAVAMRMSWDDGSMRMAEMPCPDHGGADSHGNGHAGHDHQQCLLCNVGLGSGTLPVLLSLAMPAAERPPSVATPQRPIVRKDVRAAEPRGPPGLV